MVVGIISDTHGLLRPGAEQALRTADLIMHAGDVGDPEILRKLKRIAPVFAVRGNVDTGEWAQELPLTAVVEAGSAQLLRAPQSARIGPGARVRKIRFRHQRPHAPAEALGKKWCPVP